MEIQQTLFTSFLWKLHWEVALQKAKQELYKNMFFLKKVIANVPLTRQAN